jgi:hypothetical protein
MKRSPRKNGTGNGLQEAVTRLIHSQAEMVQTQVQLAHLQATLIKDMAEIRNDMETIKAILIRHEGYLSKLPEAIRKQIGFVEKTP